jgi:hypothetical protein
MGPSAVPGGDEEGQPEDAAEPAEAAKPGVIPAEDLTSNGD